MQGKSVRLKQVLQASAILPIALMALFIAAQGVNMPYLDEYAVTAPIAVATVEGALQPSYFFQQESNHRLVFTKLTTVVNTLLTGWDLRVEMWVNFALILASFALLVRGVAASSSANSRMVDLAVRACPVCLAAAP